MKKKIIKQIPNIITITRIISLIIGFILFCKEKFLYAIILYIYGAVSDFFDGYFARRLNAYTKLGKYLDAISDKLYSFSVMILLIINRSILIKTLSPYVSSLYLNEEKLYGTTTITEILRNFQGNLYTK